MTKFAACSANAWHVLEIHQMPKVPPDSSQHPISGTNKQVFIKKPPHYQRLSLEIYLLNLRCSSERSYHLRSWLGGHKANRQLAYFVVYRADCASLPKIVAFSRMVDAQDRNNPAALTLLIGISTASTASTDSGCQTAAAIAAQKRKTDVPYFQHDMITTSVAASPTRAYC